MCAPRTCRAGAIGANLRKLHAAKRAFNKHKPQAVLYVDRLDAGRRDLADLNVSTLGTLWLLCMLCCGMLCLECLDAFAATWQT